MHAYLYIYIYIYGYISAHTWRGSGSLPPHCFRRFDSAHRQGRDTGRDVEPTDSMPRTDKAETQAETSNRRTQAQFCVPVPRTDKAERPMDKRASVRDREKDACDRGKHKDIERLYLSLSETASPPHHSPTHNAHTRTHTHTHTHARARAYVTGARVFTECVCGAISSRANTRAHSRAHLTGAVCG
jgi:hypothetical protein